MGEMGSPLQIPFGIVRLSNSRLLFGLHNTCHRLAKCLKWSSFCSCNTDDHSCIIRMTPKATFHHNLQVTLWFPFYKLITGAMWYEQYAILYDMENLCAKKLMYKAPPESFLRLKMRWHMVVAPHGGTSNP
jgi:hypothetical protein